MSDDRTGIIPKSAKDRVDALEKRIDELEAEIQRIVGWCVEAIVEIRDSNCEHVCLDAAKSALSDIVFQHDKDAYYELYPLPVEGRRARDERFGAALIEVLEGQGLDEIPYNTREAIGSVSRVYDILKQALFEYDRKRHDEMFPLPVDAEVTGE